MSKRMLLYSGLLLMSFYSQAQDTEFPKEWELQLRLQKGMATRFNSSPDLFTGSVAFVPQYTFIEHRLRGGIVTALNYSGKKWSGLFGPTVSLKIKTLQSRLFGIGNIHLTADHLWGTDQQQMAGGGPYIELLHKLLIGFTAHRDYNRNSWLFQGNIAIRLNKSKPEADPGF